MVGIGDGKTEGPEAPWGRDSGRWRLVIWSLKLDMFPPSPAAMRECMHEVASEHVSTPCSTGLALGSVWGSCHEHLVGRKMRPSAAFLLLIQLVMRRLAGAGTWIRGH